MNGLISPACPLVKASTSKSVVVMLLLVIGVALVTGLLPTKLKPIAFDTEVSMLAISSLEHPDRATIATDAKKTKVFLML